MTDSVSDKQFPKILDDRGLRTKDTLVLCLICRQHYDKSFIKSHQRYCKSKTGFK